MKQESIINQLNYELQQANAEIKKLKNKIFLIEKSDSAEICPNTDYRTFRNNEKSLDNLNFNFKYNKTSTNLLNTSATDKRNFRKSENSFPKNSEFENYNHNKNYNETSIGKYRLATSRDFNTNVNKQGRSSTSLSQMNIYNSNEADSFNINNNENSNNRENLQTEFSNNGNYESRLKNNFSRHSGKSIDRSFFKLNNNYIYNGSNN